MSLTYNTFLAALFNEVAAASTANGSSSTDPYWLAAMPVIIDEAEQRIWREGDFLAERVTDNSATTSPQQRAFSLPTAVGTYVKVEHINVITPVGTDATTGTRIPLTPVSRAMLDFGWPANSTSNGVPQQYAMQDNATILFGPVPDESYSVEVIGTQREPSLSPSNQTTYLTEHLPDLFFAAAMVRASAFMRDFTADSGDPQMGLTWETKYQTLFKSADIEETAKWYRSGGWTAQQDRPATRPPRV